MYKIHVFVIDANLVDSLAQTRAEATRLAHSRYSLVSPEQAKAWMPDTKVVDEDGKPKVVYHHTENNFTQFDLGKSRRSMDIQGFFFYDNPTAGEEYGSVSYPCYLNITRHWGLTPPTSTHP